MSTSPLQRRGARHLWFGTLLFGVVFQLTGSYRPAILALIVFFVLGAFFLLRLDPERGIREAGNRPPAVV